jgi:hypothetical protein
MKADGTLETVSYTSARETTTANLQTEIGTVAANSVIKYAATNGVLTEKMVPYTESWTTEAISDGTAGVGSSHYLAATTPIVYISANGTDLSKSTATVVTGYAKAQGATAAQATFVTENNNVVVVFVNNAYTPEVNATHNVAYVPANLAYSSSKYESGKTYYGYELYINGTATTLWSESNSITTSNNAEFVEYTVTDGYLTAVSNSITGYSSDSGAVGFVDAENAVVNGTQYKVAGASVITNTTANVVEAGGTVAVGDTVTVLINSTTHAVDYIVITGIAA